MSYTYTADFRDEYESQRTLLLRRRFLWFCAVSLGFGLIAYITAGIALAMNGSKTVGLLFMPSVFLPLILSLASSGVFVWAFWYVYRHPLPQERLLKLLFMVVLVGGVLSILPTPISIALTPNHESTPAPTAAPANATSTPSEAVPATAPDAKVVALPAADAGEKSIDSEMAEDNAKESDASNKPVTVWGSQMIRDKDGNWRTQPMSTRMGAWTVAFGGVWAIFVAHFFPCLFLPWTWKESIRPMVPVFGLHVIATLLHVFSHPWISLSGVLVAPLMLAPGIGICAWRNSRFRDRVHFSMLKGRYSEIKRELVDARRIHESLFPGPISTEQLRVAYRYEPMRQIGGDYLYAKLTTDAATGEPILNLVIVDVTGHGITAALTVNRLHGEIDRQLGERPDSSPGDLLEGLNSYLHHTLASHSVYATALCMRVEALADRLVWASAGHPPAFLRAADGTIDRLDSTTLVLGACRGDDFQHNQQSIPFHKGDVLIAYTDGAIECRNDNGKMMGVTGFQRIVASLRAGAGAPCVEELLRAVDSYRYGPLQDDTLLVEVARPV